MDKTILLANQNKEFAYDLSRFLRNLGYKTLFAEDKITAMQYCGEIPPDLLLVDEHLPDIEIFWNVNTIHERYESLPIIVLTGDINKANVVAAFRTGISDYIYKFATFNEIISNIQRFFTTLAIAKEKFLLGTCIYLPETAQIICSKERVRFLTLQQNKLLYHLCPPGKVVKAIKLRELLWHHKDDAQNSLDVLIHALRKAIFGLSIKIKNVRGLGFQLLVAE